MEVIPKVFNKLPKSWMLPEYDELRILPLGDFQWGKSTDKERIKKYIDWGIKSEMWFVGMGDYPDRFSPSNRVFVSQFKSQAYDNAVDMVYKTPEQDTNEIAELLAPSKGRWIGLLKGHHWAELPLSNTVTLLSEKLGTQNAGDCVVYELKFINPKDKEDSLVAKIWAHHGVGSGMVSTSPLTRLEHMTKTFEAHVYLMGHQSKKGVSVIPWLSFNNGKMEGYNRYIVATGGFSHGYELGSKDDKGFPAGTYVEQKMLQPAALGAPMLMIRPMFDVHRIDINVSV